MWAALIGVPAGKPERFTTKVPVAAVTLPAVSLVVTMVIVAVPLPAASAPTMAGFSLAGDSVAVKVGFVGPDGVVEDEPHAETRTPRAMVKRDRRFIEPTPFT